MSNSIRETNILGAETRQFSRNAMDCQALAEAGIDSVGFGHMGRDYYSGRNSPQLTHMASCFAGSGEVYSGGSWMPFVPGLAVFQPAGHANAARSLEGKPLSFFWIFFNRSSRFLKSRLFLKPSQRMRDSLAASGALMELCCEGMGRQRASPEIERACVQLICAWLEELLFEDGVSGRLDPLWVKVSGQLGRKWDTRSLAKMAGVSPTHLRRICAAESQISPMRRLAALRMERAKTLLSVMDMKMEEVASQAGYANMFAFSAAFKRHVGMPPSAWREKARQ